MRSLDVVPSPPAPLTTCLVGMVRSPRRTCERVAANPRWAGMLLVTWCLATAARVGLMSTAVGRQALTDQWVHRAEAFGQNVGDGLYAQFQWLGEHGLETAVLTSVASGPLLAFVLAACLRLGSDPGDEPTQGSDPGVGATQGWNGSGAPPYRRVLSVVVHANVILAVRDVVAAPVNYLRESIASPLTVATFFPMLDESSPAAPFLAMIDFFLVWWLLVLAVGTAVLYRRPVRPVALTYLGLYVAFAMATAAAMAVSGGSV